MSTAENRPVGPAGVLMPEKDDLQKEPAGVLLSVILTAEAGGSRHPSMSVSISVREKPLVW